MSTPDHPHNAGLTRKQLREIRMTGATPVVTPDVQLPHAAEPVETTPAPTPDSEVDLGVSPLTRRQAREQERIRTASVPVITPAMAEADTSAAQVAAMWAPPGTAETNIVESAEEVEEIEEQVAEPVAEQVAEPVFELEVEREPEPEPEPEPEERPVLRPEFGAGLLEHEESMPLAPSFDELIARGGSTTGSTATASALILAQSPASGPLTSPVTATGEVLITGTFALPEGFGSRGHAEGVADGKEVDAVLVDGELPASSSPTPIAASAAVSTIKGTGEIIRPPAPEKGNKLMLGLAITAGVLAAALIGVLIVAFITGVFS